MSNDGEANKVVQLSSKEKSLADEPQSKGKQAPEATPEPEVPGTKKQPVATKETKVESESAEPIDKEVSSKMKDLKVEDGAKSSASSRLRPPTRFDAPLADSQPNELQVEAAQPEEPANDEAAIDPQAK